MSRSDNTRPYWVSGSDLTELGEVHHWCWRKDDECDYDRRRPPRTKQEYDQRRCYRVLDHPGGTNCLGGSVKYQRKLRRRRIRQRERQQLWLAKWLGREAEFDLLPIREDRHTILFDLT